MKREAAISLSIAVASFVLLYPAFAHTQNVQNTQDMTTATIPASAQQEVNVMVSAQARLLRALDARKIQQGHQFQAVLNDTVHLKNGPELPRGTTLVGTVATDQMQDHGTSKLALRFTDAELKSGKVIPIDATIMGVFAPSNSDSQSGPYPWDGHTLQVDQIDAASGADLHSTIASGDSGVFVSSSKDDVKLSAGSQITLAIAAQQNNEQGKTGMSGGA
ncbi:MAG: hypothetical protein ABR923_04610 [Terracidiphilus sp.]|jgi:hypothetical protein